MILLLSSKLLTKHIMLPLYYRMCMFWVLYFLLIKLHSLNTEVFCMQENIDEDHANALKQIENLTTERDALVQQYADLSATSDIQKKAYDHVKSEFEGNYNIRNFGKTMAENISLKQQNKELLRDNADMHSSYTLSQHNLKEANKTITYYSEKQISVTTEKNSSSSDETALKKELTDIYY